MPIAKVYGVHPSEAGKLSEVRTALKQAVCGVLQIPETSMAAFFPSDLDSSSFEGDVVLDLMSKSFIGMSEEKKVELTTATNTVLKKYFPSTDINKRRLWETFLITAPSYGIK